MANLGNFYPYNFIERYANLMVCVDDVYYVPASVTDYRCVKKFTFDSKGCDDALKVKDAFLTATKFKIPKEFGPGGSMMDFFTGKASPELMEMGLAAVWKNKDAFIDAAKRSADPDIGKAAKILEKDAGDAIKEFAEAYLGLDCNGFVGNYLKRFKPPWGLGPQNDPGQWFSTLKSAGRKFRSSIDEVEVGDVVVNIAKNHIGVVDLPSIEGRVDIAQSGGKIMYSTHNLAPGPVKEDKPTLVIAEPTGGFAGNPTVWIMQAIVSPK